MGSFIIVCPWKISSTYKLLPSHPSPSKLHFLLAYLQVTVVNHFGNDVTVVLQLEVDQVWLAVLDFIDGWLFAGIGMDVGEGAVVEDGRDLEGLLRLVVVLKTQRCRIFGSVFADFFFFRLLRLRLGQGHLFLQ